MTVRDCGSSSPSCSDISHHCQLSRFRVRQDIHHQLTGETLVERGRIGIFMDKGSKYPSCQCLAPVLSSIIDDLTYLWLVASCTHVKRHTVKDSVSLSWQRNICLSNYIWSRNKSYVLSKSKVPFPSNPSSNKNWLTLHMVLQCPHRSGLKKTVFLIHRTNRMWKYIHGWGLKAFDQIWSQHQICLLNLIPFQSNQAQLSSFLTTVRNNLICNLHLLAENAERVQFLGTALSSQPVVTNWKWYDRLIRVKV